MGNIVSKEGSKATVNSSALHVFEVLRFVADTPEPLGVTEISRRLSLPVSTVFRALTTLEESGYIQRFQNAPRFEIGTMPYLLNRALLSRFALHAESRETLRALAEASEDTVSLWMRLGWYAVRIGGAFGRRDTYHHARLGDVVLLHEHPAGRTILTELAGSERSEYETFVQEHHPSRLPSLVDDPGQSNDMSDLTPERPDGARFRATCVAIRDHCGVTIGAIASEGPASASDELPGRLRQASLALENLIAASPERYKSPFAHIGANNVRLNLASVAEQIA